MKTTAKLAPLDIQRLQFELTSYCNANCPHCGRFDNEGNLHPDLTLSHLNADLVLENLQLNTMTSLSEIILEGDKGDPVMHPDIEKIVDVFYNLSSQPTIHLTTNGGIRNADWWYNLAKLYPNLRVVFSIDGLDDTNHLYRVGVKYKKVMENAQAFIKGGGYAIWKFLAFGHNEHQLDTVRSLSEELGFSAFTILPGDRSRFNGLKSWPVMVSGKLSHYIKPASDNISDTPKLYVYKKYNKITRQIRSTNRICPNLSNGHVYINHQGYVIPCCMMHFDTENNYFGKDQLIELTEGLENQSLITNTLSTILNNKFFNNNLIDSLNKSEDNWHFNCQRSCKQQIQERKNEQTAI